jgi:hypothetical protein
MKTKTTDSITATPDYESVNPQFLSQVSNLLPKSEQKNPPEADSPKSNFTFLVFKS